MSTTKNPAIAATIRRQLGTALPMLGAKNLLVMGRGLQFKIGRNPKRVTHVQIDLAGDDTYTIKFLRVPSVKKLCAGAEPKTLAECAGVQVGSLHDTLEAHTGNFTRL